MKNRITVLLLLVILAGLLGAAFWMNSREAAPVENAGKAVHAAQEPVSLRYLGEEYPMKEHLKTVLLIGTDNMEYYEKKEGALQDYYNYTQADFLVLLVQDTEAGTTEVIQLNRDTMMEVPWLPL